MKPSQLPCLGKETVFSLDVVSLAHGKIKTPMNFIIRCSKDGDTNDYKVLEVFRKPIKLIRYDCICLERFAECGYACVRACVCMCVNPPCMEYKVSMYTYTSIYFLVQYHGYEGWFVSISI